MSDGHTVDKLSQRRLTADWLAHGRVTVHGCTVRSPLTGRKVTSRPRNRFSRHSNWTDTFRTALVYYLRLLRQATDSGILGFRRGALEIFALLSLCAAHVKYRRFTTVYRFKSQGPKPLKTGPVCCPETSEVNMSRSKILEDGAYTPSRNVDNRTRAEQEPGRAKLSGSCKLRS
jgi:hypothetical protein